MLAGKNIIAAKDCDRMELPMIDFVMLVLAILLSPGNAKEVKVNYLNPTNGEIVNTVKVSSNGDGFILYGQSGSEFVLAGSLTKLAGQASTYQLKIGDTEKTIILPEGFLDLQKPNFQDGETRDLKAGEKLLIHIKKSGDTIYISRDDGIYIYAGKRVSGQ
jgi:hypothetical protein